MKSDLEVIRYFCGCERRVHDKVCTFCEHHESQRYSYEEILNQKRRLKEMIRLGVYNTKYLKRQLTNKRKEKKSFWSSGPQVLGGYRPWKNAHKWS